MLRQPIRQIPQSGATALLGRQVLPADAINPTIQYIHTVLRNALSNVERDEIITRNVAKLVRIPAPRYKIGKGLPVGDVKRILAEAQHTRLYALYVLAATLGFRRGELLGLRCSDLDLNLGIIASTKTVQRVKDRLLIDDTKTEESDNTIPVPKITHGS